MDTSPCRSPLSGSDAAHSGNTSPLDTSSSARLNRTYPNVIGIQNRLGKIQLERLAFEIEMIASNIEEEVKSSDYFYSTVKFLNKTPEEPSLLRPKKFKHLKSIYSEDKEYQAIKVKKKEALEILKQKIEAIQEGAPLKKLLISHAQKGIPFDHLSLPDFGKNGKLIKKAYEDYLVLYNKIITEQKSKNLTDLSQLFTPCTINEKEIARLGKLKEVKRDTDKIQKIFEGLSDIWKSKGPEMYQLCMEAPELNTPVKDYRKLVFQHFKNIGEEKLAKDPCCQLVYMLIWNRMCDQLKEYNNIQNNSESITKVLEENPDLIEIYTKTTAMEDFENICFLLKEQKQHTFARFGKLAELYEDFIRHAKILENIVDTLIIPEKGFIIKKTLIELLQHSHYHGLNQNIKKYEKKQDNHSQSILRILQQQQKGLTVRDTHHSKDTMGYQKKSYFQEHEQTNAIYKVNKMLQLFGTKLEMTKFDHAHTMPFPAMFNWKPEKIKLILANFGIDVDEKIHSQKKYLSANFFKTIKEGVPSKTLDILFIKELYNIKKECDPETFVFYAFILLQRYHFTMFSETELLPELINSYSDAFSEWSISESAINGNHYKKSIALAMIKLLEKDVITKEMVTEALSEYYTQTISKIHKEDLYEKDNNKCTIVELFKKITALQVEQSLILAKRTSNLKTDYISSIDSLKRLIIPNIIQHQFSEFVGV